MKLRPLFCRLGFFTLLTPFFAGLVACGDDDDGGAQPPLAGASGTGGTSSGTGGAAGQGQGGAGAGGSAGASGGGGQGGVPTVHGTPFCSDDGWCLTNPTPQGSTLLAVHGSRDDDIWAAGEDGAVIHWDGVAWGRMPSPSPTFRPSAIWAFEPNDVWLVGQHLDGSGESVFCHWDGTSWAQKGLTVQTTPQQIWASSPDDIWLGGYASVLWHWQGGSWQEVPAPLPDTVDVEQLWGTSANDLWAVTQLYAGDSYPHVLTHYDGTAWSRVDLPVGLEPRSIAGTSATDVIVVAVTGFEEDDERVVLRRDGGGWAPEPVAAGHLLNGPVVSNTNGIWFGGTDDRFDHRAGGLWTQELVVSDDPKNQGDFYAMWASPAGDVWAVGENGSIARRTAGAWRRETKGDNVTSNAAIWGRSDNDLWMASSTATLQHWDGNHWTPSPVIEGLSWGYLDRVWLTGDATGTAWVIATHDSLGYYNRIARWNGTSWAMVPSNDESDDVLYHTPFAVGGSLYGVGQRPFCTPNCPEVAGLWRTDGTSFETIPGCVPFEASDIQVGRSVWASGPDDVRVIYNKNSYPLASYIMRVANGACTFDPLPGEDTLYQVLGGASGDDLWALTYGVASHWDGTTWTSQSTEMVTPDRIIVLAPNDIWVSDPYAGTAHHWDGSTWTTQHAPLGLRDLWASPGHAIGIHDHNVFERH